MRFLLAATLLLSALFATACGDEDDYGTDLACAAGPRDMKCGATD